MYALNKRIKGLTLNWNRKSLKLILKNDDWIKIKIRIRNFIAKGGSWILCGWIKR